jgi:N6-L-threonylcarbamoyladenine synthase
MRILAIETSCDETAISIVEAEGTLPAASFRVLADNTLTQIEMHREYGGVFPMVAKREHARTLVPLLVKTLQDAKLYKKTSRHVIESPLREEFQEILEREPELFGQFLSIVTEIDPPEIDVIAVTQGPGLEPALWVGINFAKALALIWKKPIVPINHMEGHLLAPLLKEGVESRILTPITFPAVGLLVSGGHTELILMKDYASYEIIGETRDDAAGEAFDKVARILGLPYPGGPEISKLATSGTVGIYPLPRPMLHSGDYGFSFAGLKTAVLYLVKKLGALTEIQRADIAREFEEACVEVLTTKTMRAVDEFGAHAVILGGGVSANKRLRETLTTKAANAGITLFLPSSELSTDNALMIAIAAYFGKHSDSPSTLKARGNWRITEAA